MSHGLRLLLMMWQPPLHLVHHPIFILFLVSNPKLYRHHDEEVHPPCWFLSMQRDREAVTQHRMGSIPVLFDGFQRVRPPPHIFSTGFDTNVWVQPFSTHFNANGVGSTPPNSSSMFLMGTEWVQRPTPCFRHFEWGWDGFNPYTTLFRHFRWGWRQQGRVEPISLVFHVFDREWVQPHSLSNVWPFVSNFEQQRVYYII